MAAKVDQLLNNFENSQWLIDANDIQIGKELGVGASGVTYTGEHKGVKVAIKSYSMAILTNDINSVKNEIDILSKLQHKNIVQFRGMMLRRNPPSASLVTKFVQRGELGDVLYKTWALKRQGNGMRFKIVLGLAEGLKYLHAHNVIHRDIKPANILLGDDFEPMLTDFGFSRFFDRDSKEILTGETGSYRYMAPEVTRHSHYTEKADVYSFALICNEIFCDERPFEYQVAAVVAMDVVKKNLRPSQKKIRNERLKRIIVRCWDKDASQRPDWDEVIEELNAAKTEMESNRGNNALSSLFRKHESNEKVSGKTGKADGKQAVESNSARETPEGEGDSGNCSGSTIGSNPKS